MRFKGLPAGGTIRGMKIRFSSLVVGTLFLLALPALAEDEEARPTAPDKPVAAATPKAAATPAPKATPKKKRGKRNAYQNQDLQLAPAPLMIQKP